MLKIGDFLMIEINDGLQNDKHRSKVIDLDNEAIYIEYPVNLKTNKTTFLMIGTPLYVSFVSDDNQAYWFLSEIIGRTKNEIPLLILRRPKEVEIKRIQRREFVRIKWPVDIAVHSLEKEFSPFCSVTEDISAGGVSFIAPKQIPLKENQLIICWLVLPMQSGKYHYLKLKSKIVRIFSLNEYSNTVSVQFIDKNSQEEQKLIRFSFEAQLALKQKVMKI